MEDIISLFYGGKTMKNTKSTESGDGSLVISARSGCEGLKERFFELNVLYAVRNNLNRAIDLVKQNGLHLAN
ncbi:MAG: hypothetical protein HYV59_05290 [Planctomycetes bacterium]|nr:hypothetical protein [Planctomycetota bacterium]